jgi:TPR repeat protein
MMQKLIRFIMNLFTRKPVANKDGDVISFSRASYEDTNSMNTATLQPMADNHTPEDNAITSDVAEPDIIKQITHILAEGKKPNFSKLENEFKNDLLDKTDADIATQFLAMQQGETSLFITIAEKYYYGIDVKEDRQKARKWAVIGSQAGMSDALILLGKLYRRDNDAVFANDKIAIAFLNLAIKKGNTLAVCELADLYDSGSDETPEDDELALKYYLEAAQRNEVAAYTCIASLYLYSTVVKTDVRRAIEWYEKAYATGDAFAASCIGDLYREGYEELSAYPKQAFEWYTKAVALDNDANSLLGLGLLYLQGQDVGRDPKKALDYFLKAASQDNANAKYQIGLLYRDGIGVEKDHTLAKKWLQAAANDGNDAAVEAMKHL